MGWLRSYDRGWLGADLLVGDRGPLWVIPRPMGYATVAGLPVEIGFYTYIFPMLIYALFGDCMPTFLQHNLDDRGSTGLAITAADPGSTDLVGTATTLSSMVGAFVIASSTDQARLDAGGGLGGHPGRAQGWGLTIIADQLPNLLRHFDGE